MQSKYDLEERLIEFAVLALNMVDILPNKYSANHLGNQLVKSTTSPALNYGEAQAAESKKDFVHKMGIILKELRESLICIKIIEKRNYVSNNKIIEKLKQENKELVAIFTTSIKTVKSKI